MNDACKIKHKIQSKITRERLKFYKFHIAPRNSTRNSYADVNFQIRPTLKFHLLPKIYH